MAKAVSFAQQKVAVTVTTTGSDGSATGTGATGHVRGNILAIHLDYSAGQAATTDVTIATTTAPVRTVLVRTSSATDGWFYPRVQVQDTAAANIAGEYTPIPVDDSLTVTIAEADNAETVIVTVLVGQ